MIGFKNKNTGPLKEFLEECDEHRLEAIYNYDYRYIKEIIYDEDLEKKYGNTRKGYEEFKKNEPGTMSYNDTYLRTRRDKEGNILGYMSEKALKTNDKLNMIAEIYERAELKFREILGVTCPESFNYWFDSLGWYDEKLDVNNLINRIKRLEGILTSYDEDENFRSFIDKIKK